MCELQFSSLVSPNWTNITCKIAVLYDINVTKVWDWGEVTTEHVQPRVTGEPHRYNARGMRGGGAGACVNKIKIHCQYELESCNQGFDTHLSFSTFLNLKS